MTPQTNPSSLDDALDAVLAIISLLAMESAKKNFIFRGEPEHYPKVSSSLYRQYQNIDAEQFDIETMQGEIIEEARRYTNDSNDFEILTQLQHFGGKTNLIDFTTDYLTALFFACDGSPSKDGRVVMLEKATSGKNYDVRRPINPVNRVIAQKSIFVRPSRGYVEPDRSICITHRLKQPTLSFLRTCHGLSSEAIYNDLLGFIRVQDLHKSAYADFYLGLTHHNRKDYSLAVKHYTFSIELNPNVATAYNNRGSAYLSLDKFDRAIQDLKDAVAIAPNIADSYCNLGIAYNKKKHFETAIRHFNQALALDPKMSQASFGRGVTWLCMSEWSKAEADLALASSQGLDIANEFQAEYVDIASFEERYNVSLPECIMEMLQK